MILTKKNTINHSIFNAFFLLIMAQFLYACGGSGADSPEDNSAGDVAANVAPSVDAGNDQTYNAGQQVSLLGVANDSDGVIALYAWQQISGPTVTLTGANTANASFIAPDTEAEASVILIFTLLVTDDDAATASDSVTITVNKVNNAPLIAGVPTVALVDRAYSFSPTLTDSDGDTLTVTITNAPNWIVLNAETGALSGTPVTEDIGLTSNVTLTVSDGALSNDLVFELHVVNAATVIAAALSSGDYRHIPAEDIFYSAISDELNANGSDFNVNTATLKIFFTQLEDNSFSFNLVDCDDKSCPSDSAYYPEFWNILVKIKSRIDGFDINKTNIFASANEYRLEKLMVLLADYYRATATFPRNRSVAVGYNEYNKPFLQSIYADHLVHVNRAFNLVQTDLGTYSRSDFSHITPVNNRLTMLSRVNFRATGIYAIPGQTLRITRTDTNAVTTWVSISSVRAGTTRFFNRNKYNRPLYVQSPKIAISPGESIQLTSPYGGPVQLWFNQSDINVAFEFENIGHHAFWDGAEDNTRFLQALAANDFDWAEFVTPDFEVHTSSLKMTNSLARFDGDGIEGLYNAITQVFMNYIHVLAAYSSDRFEAVPEIDAFTASNGLQQKTLAEVKHVNADQAACSTACSGNPYDTDSQFDPYASTTHQHELAHGVELQRRFDGWGLHTVTDLYYHYTAYRRTQNAGGSETFIASNCNGIEYESLFNIIQESRNTADPFAFMQAQNIYTNWRNAITLSIQLMAMAQNEGILTDGWNMLAQLHIIENTYNKAIGNDVDWANYAVGLGFGDIPRAEAITLSGNDWMLLSLSHVTQLNLSDYLTAWGFTLTESSKNYIAAKDYTSAPLVYYPFARQDHCRGFTKTALPIDGTTPWPSGV